MKFKGLYRFLIIVLCVFAVYLVAIASYNKAKKKYERPDVKSLSVFNQKIAVENGKYAYRIDVDDASITLKNDACTVPYKVAFKNKYKVSNDVSYVQKNDHTAYLFINARKKDVKDNSKNKNAYTLFIEINSKNTINIDKECNK